MTIALSVRTLDLKQLFILSAKQNDFRIADFLLRLLSSLTHIREATRIRLFGSKNIVLTEHNYCCSLPNGWTIKAVYSA